MAAPLSNPVFDNPAVQSIGAVAIDPGNPKIVWVGTGESWVRNSVSIGDGIYKSTDGGENWTNVGLKDSEHIAKILIDPGDGNTVYACATGHLWDDNTERGVYKTTDGGKTWRKVLAGANGSTGCAMLAMNPQDPKTIYASLWDFRRQALDVPLGRSGQRPVQIHRWRRALDRTHAGQRQGTSREAVRPHRAGGGAFQAAGGLRHDRIREERAVPLRRWRPQLDALDASQFMVWRPFYFANLIVDPKDENKVFKVRRLAAALHRRRPQFQPGLRQRPRRFSRRVDRPQPHRHGVRQATMAACGAVTMAGSAGST